MNETLYIPKKLNVGYQSRQDTYSGKLGYVIYWDDKNKLRKETSWENWRDKQIQPDVFDNTPISGFVINKQVGGARSGYYSWDARIEKVRVYDPRGFEFEISIPNLLFILQESNSMKGKGLEGDFIYAWAGTELVLLPTDTAEYKKCVEYTDMQAVKITKDTMIPGCMYKFKDNQECIYLGRLDYFTLPSHEIKNHNATYRWERSTTEYCYQKGEKKHVFIKVEDVNKTKDISYRIESGFTKVGQVLTTEPVANYAELLDVYKSHKCGGKITNIEFIQTPLVFDDLIFSWSSTTLNIYLGDNIIYEFGISKYTDEYSFRYTPKIIKLELVDGVFRKYEIYDKHDAYHGIKSHHLLNMVAKKLLTEKNEALINIITSKFYTKDQMADFLKGLNTVKCMITNEYGYTYEN